MRRWGRELTVRLLRDRYDALARLRREHGGADWFPVRMLGRRAVVVRGEEGVRSFYDPTLVTRKGAIPAPLRLLLFGPGPVHGLNGSAHAERKQVFLDVIDPHAVGQLHELVRDRLDAARPEWAARDRVLLFDALVDVYGTAALEWAATGTTGEEASRISRELALIVDGFGLGGTSHARAALARVRAQRWAMRVIRDVREGRLAAPPTSPAGALAARRDLSVLVAATELLNLVRPTVAVAYFGAWAAHALTRRPDWRAFLADGSPRHLRAFELEIRRWYPFVPLLPGRVERDHDLAGLALRRRDWVVLDILGTNRDPGLWDRPEEFRPERFLDREPTAWDYVPHGGGDPARGHRCPGEPIAGSLLEVTIQHLARFDYDLAHRGRRVPASRIPALAPDRMTLNAPRPAAGTTAGSAGPSPRHRRT
ncbi:cytochrome P450 [Nocardioides sp. SYSU DS0651]|uniref:cytochrome P450 n=1 Tax=Nocardioides sp. SYSU DS0651 TaxID=3415955 RepID=UPI003F4B9090